MTAECTDLIGIAIILLVVLIATLLVVWVSLSEDCQ